MLYKQLPPIHNIQNIVTRKRMISTTNNNDLEPLLGDYLGRTHSWNYRLEMDDINVSDDEVAKQNHFSNSNFLILSKHLE